jgi:non-ribosomal peptide synthetase component F
VVFGAVVSGRPAELRGVEQMLGLFINTLPVRVRVEEELKVAEWLRELQAEQVELRQYEYSPLVAVQGWSEVERGRPLFESLLVFENYPVDTSLREHTSDVAISSFHTVQRTNYPLSLAVEAGQELSLQFTYDRRRFDQQRITQISNHLRAILESIVVAPEQRLSEIEMLTAAERRQMVVEWNETAVEYPQEQCIHELFEQQVERTPEAVALVFEAEQVNYRELNERANQLAHYLRQLGVGPEARVGICVERSVEMVVGLLGILKAGGAYVPLDAQYPEERLRFMLADAQVGVLLTQEQLLGRLPDHEAQVVCLDRIGKRIGQQGEQNPESAATADNLAYIIYTSGSTGTPKGVSISHRAINRLVMNSNYVQLVPSDKVAQASNVSFDAATFELWGACCTERNCWESPKR